MGKGHSKVSLSIKIEIILYKVKNFIIVAPDAIFSAIVCSGKAEMICSDDKKRVLQRLSITFDGVGVCGVSKKICAYPETCLSVQSLAYQAAQNTVFISHKGNPGGVLSLDLESAEMKLVIENRTIVCMEASGITIFGAYLLVSDVGARQIKLWKGPEGVDTVAGSGVEGTRDGPASSAQFGQVMGICQEFDKNIYVADAQAGTIRLITTIKGSVQFLLNLRKLYSAFSLTEDKQDEITFAETIKVVGEVAEYHSTTCKEVQELINTTRLLNGPEGTISNKTRNSVQIIHDELQHLYTTLVAINANLEVNLQTLLTLHVENLHALGHFKEQFPTQLQYARNLANTVKESLKREMSWAAFYYTHKKSYYPVIDSGLTLVEMPTIPHLKPAHPLNTQQQVLMREWADANGKCVRQRTVRQENTKDKAGTLPLNLYTRDILLSSKVVFDEQDQETIAEPGDALSEYESDSGDDVPIEDTREVRGSLTFLKGLQTKSGRQVKISKQWDL